MDGFSMSLDSLEHGWAFLTIEDNTRCMKYMISDVGPDPLTGIVNTAIHLARGQDSAIRFNLEPEIIPYEMKTGADGTFLLTVGNDAFRGSMLRYIRQALGMFDRYTFDHGESEYAAQWRHVFPNKGLDCLRSWLRSA